MYIYIKRGKTIYCRALSSVLLELLRTGLTSLYNKGKFLRRATYRYISLKRGLLEGNLKVLLLISLIV
jgi:TfoX/Sxy family transcriptional regulator of competence genes